MTYNMISIDQSLTNTGIVVWTELSGYDFKLFQTEKTKNTKCPTIDYTRRIVMIKDEIKKICFENNIQKGIIEGAAFGANGHLYDLGGLGHASRIALVECGVDFVVIPPKTAKKYFTGNGNANKQDMIEEAKNRKVKIPYMKKYSKILTDFDDNVVDSYCFMCFLRDLYDGKLDSEFLDKVEYSTDI